MALADKLRSAFQNPRRAGRMALQEVLFRRSLAQPLTRGIGPRRAARLAARTIDADGWRRGAPTLLVLDRLYFEKDVVELRRRGRFNYITINTHVLSVAQECWLPEELREQISYVPRSGPQHRASWDLAETFAREILAVARRRWNVAAVLASNVDYWQHESFRTACNEAGVPFLVLCQEQQTVPFTYAISVDLYRNAAFQYRGHGVAVFEGRTRDMLIESGCCEPEQVGVTGAPRLDPWFDADRARPAADRVTLLAFDGDQYFAPQCYLETLRVFARASLEHAHSPLRFVLKCKDNEDEQRAARHLDGVEHRLEITHVAPLTGLFPRSRLVIGYNSLAILEALLSPAELAVPQWSDAKRPREEQNVDPNDAECRSHFRFVDNPQALAALLAEVVAKPLPVADMAARRRLLRRWFHVPEDGSATRAFEQFAETFLGGTGGRVGERSSGHMQGGSDARLAS